MSEQDGGQAKDREPWQAVTSLEDFERLSGTQRSAMYRLDPAQYAAYVDEMRERNEALDCYVYARAAAAVVGLDRFEERHWRQLERQLGTSKGSEADRESADRSVPKRDAPKTRPPGISRKSEPWLGGRQRHWLRRD